MKATENQSSPIQVVQTCAPEEYSRRILVAVTGLTPQVVTETLYALAIESPNKFVPTEIHVITTKEGADRARLMLLDAKDGKFHAMCRDYALPEIKFPSTHIHVIPDSVGNPLVDIRTPQDNLRAADFISHLVKNFCQDEKAALHVSIAGGRKSMGFFMGYALSMFGRKQDRLSHVLVNDPFESLADFYFKPTQGHVMLDRNQRPVHTDDAIIMLAEIPFVRLRGGIPESLLAGDASFAETVSGVQSGLGLPTLEFDIARHAICCGGKWIDMAPHLFAFYLWLAKRCVMGEPENGAVYRLNNHLGADFLNIYGKVVNTNNEHYQKVEKSLGRGILDVEFFEQKVTNINKLIKKALPLDYLPYLVNSPGRSQTKRDELKLSPSQIEIPMAVRN